MKTAVWIIALCGLFAFPGIAFAETPAQPGVPTVEDQLKECRSEASRLKESTDLSELRQLAMLVYGGSDGTGCLFLGDRTLVHPDACQSDSPVKRVYRVNSPVEITLPGISKRRVLGVIVVDTPVVAPPDSRILPPGTYLVVVSAANDEKESVKLELLALGVKPEGDPYLQGHYRVPGTRSVKPVGHQPFLKEQGAGAFVEVSESKSGFAASESTGLGEMKYDVSVHRAVVTMAWGGIHAAWGSPRPLVSYQFQLESLPLSTHWAEQQACRH